MKLIGVFGIFDILLFLAGVGFIIYLTIKKKKTAKKEE